MILVESFLKINFVCYDFIGRLAMIAIIADAAQEYVSGIPVVLQTPFFFGDPIL